jgi:translation initiation factor 1A
MPKKLGGGNKQKKKKRVTTFNEERELIKKDEGQEYGQVKRLLGNCRLEVECIDGVTRICHIRGTLTKKKVWIKLSDLVLVSLRDFEDAKGDVIHLYSMKEVARLKVEEEIPLSIKITDDVAGEKAEIDDIGVEFFEEGEEEHLKEKEKFRKNFEDNFTVI